jgi:hypothetical protein
MIMAADRRGAARAAKALRYRRALYEAAVAYDAARDRREASEPRPDDRLARACDGEDVGG